jgi:formate dehydrogenase
MPPSDKKAERDAGKSFHHPGAGRRKAKLHPKGRQTDPDRLAEIGQLLGDRPRRRDLLIEFLHLVQDRYGCLGPGHLSALADEMSLSMAEVYEVATFYAHFDVIDAAQMGEGAGSVAPPTTVRVCESLCCSMKGASSLRRELETALGDEYRVVGAPCMGGCDQAPAISIGARQLGRATAESVVALVDDMADGKATHLPNYSGFEAYRAKGGYELFTACRAGRTTPADVMDILDRADLRGMGGAFFPTARKWRLVAEQPDPRLVAINADEGEVGTFKDRYFLETEPHRVLEGILVAAWAVDARTIYFYLRDEYSDCRGILETEIEELRRSGLIDDGPEIELRRGAGAYICGEESAMIESIEGKRGLPRHRPPYVAEVGLFGRPTLVNNVETMFWVRELIENGLDQGENAPKQALRAYSISGRVKDPGVKLAPIGISVNALIEDYCGGLEDGHTFKAYLPGGASGGILPASMGDMPLEPAALAEHGCFVGSAAIVVLSDQDNVASAALNLMKFFEHESCGQCTPCRVGTAKAVQLMQEPKWDVELLGELSNVMRDASICGLGQAAPNPLDSTLNFFKEDFSN